jgi:hypothetical protein
MVTREGKKSEDPASTTPSAGQADPPKGSEEKAQGESGAQSPATTDQEKNPNGNDKSKQTKPAPKTKSDAAYRILDNDSFLLHVVEWQSSGIQSVATLRSQSLGDKLGDLTLSGLRKKLAGTMQVSLFIFTTPDQSCPPWILMLTKMVLASRSKSSSIHSFCTSKGSVITDESITLREYLKYDVNHHSTIIYFAS